jgi:predicted dehydrogenase
MIGIGVIGAGRICPAHAGAASALPETRLVGIADSDTSRAQAAGERFDVPAFGDWKDLLQADGLDAVVIGLPHFLHLSATLDALAAGKHVLIEKPMALDAAECDRILAAARAAGRQVMVAHSQHYFPANREARRLIAAGEFGDIVLATDTWYKPFHEGVRPAWFLDDACGGGMWSMNGAHMIDRLMFLLQSPVVSVRARIGNPIFGLSTDAAIAFLEFASGVCATIQHAGYREGVNRFEAEFTGTQAQLKLTGDRGGGDVLWIGRGGRWNDHAVPPLRVEARPGATLSSPIFAAQLQDFARALLSGNEMPIPGDYGREVVAVMDACLRSSRENCEVRLDRPC